MRRCYHAEPERVAHDDFKDFDVIVPRRLGKHMSESKDHRVSDIGMEGSTISVPGRAPKPRRRIETDPRKFANTKQSSATSEDTIEALSKSYSAAATERPDGGKKLSALLKSTRSKKQVPSTLLPQGRKVAHTKKNFIAPGSPEYQTQIYQGLQAMGDNEGFAVDNDTPLSSFSAAVGSRSNVATKGGAVATTTSVGVEEVLQDKNYSSRPSPLQDGAIDENGGVNIREEASEPSALAERSQQMEQSEEHSIFDNVEAQDLWPDLDKKTDLETLKQAGLDKPLSVQSALNQGILKDEIHILGTGVIGRFIAHSLVGLSHPPQVTLLMQTPLSMQQWHEEGESITLYKQGRIKTHTGFNIESVAIQRRTHPRQWGASFGRDLQHTVQNPTTVIDTLIVTTAAKVTVPAILAVRDRLRPTSTICLVHDGLGVLEDLNAIVFPDPAQRPTYILGKMTGATNLISRPERRFMVEQTGDVALTCSKQPQRAVSKTDSGITISRTDHSWKLSASYLMGALARTPELNTKPLAHKSFMYKQLHSVLAHAVIGPISVMYDCNYLDLLQNFHAKVAMRGLIEELSGVVLAFPELQSLPDVGKTLSPVKLEVMVRRVLGNNHKAVSTMLQNVREGKRTDIDYYNGYLLLRAAELGIECPRNEMLINVVKGKQSIVSKQRFKEIPLVETQ